MSSFWAGFEKQAMMPSLNPLHAARALMGRGAARVGQAAAGGVQKARGGLQTAKTLGKGAVIGAGTLGAGSMLVRAGAQPGMSPMQGQPVY